MNKLKRLVRRICRSRTQVSVPSNELTVEMRHWVSRLSGKGLDEVVEILGPPIHADGPLPLPPNAKPGKLGGIRRHYEFALPGARVHTVSLTEFENGMVMIGFPSNPNAKSDDENSLA